MLLAQKLTARAASSNELEQHFLTMCHAFQLDETLARPIYQHDPFFDPALKRVLVDNGKIVSVLTIVPAALQFAGGVSIPVAGIAGVGTPPPFRNLGYAGMLIRKTIESLHTELSFPLAALVTDRPDYYRPFGFATASTRLAWHALASDLPRNGTTENVEVLSAAQAAAVSESIHAVHEDAFAGTPGTFVRSDKRWVAIETHTPGRTIAVWRTHSSIEGYVAYDISIRHGDRVLNVQEIVSRQPEGLRALMAFLAESEPGTVVKGEANQRTFNELELDRAPGVSFERLPGVMLRIADIEGVLTALANAHNFRAVLAKSTSGLTIRTDAFGSKRQDKPIRLFSVTDGPGRSRVAMAPADELVDDWIAGDIESLTMLISGFESAVALRAVGRLRVSSATAVALADELFPYTDPILSPPDMF